MILFDLIHFDRPFWLLAIPITLLLAAFLQSSSSVKNTLNDVIDPNLFKHLEYKNNTSNTNAWLGLIAILFCWIGLAGISWTKLPTVMFESTQKTILIVDQSLSMYATDIKPNRQTQLKQTVRDILEQTKEGDIALVAFAGEGFVISPFSQDKETITHFLLALEPIIMPVYGSDLSSGIETALSLSKDDTTPFHLIIFTDDLSAQDQQQIPKLLNDLNIRLDLIAIGTEKSSIIKLPDGRILKQNGKNIVPTTPINRLKNLTNTLGGDFYHGRLTPSELVKISNTSLNNQQTEKAQNKSVNWIDQGHWFALPFLIWLALQFRRGMMLMLFLTLLSVPSEKLEAAPLDWLLTKDQKAQQAVDRGNWQEAEELFTQPDWKAASSYALENYASTIETLNTLDRSASENYNLGNAFALFGDTKKAIRAYQKALEQDPTLDAAKENLNYLEQQEREKEKNRNKSNMSKIKIRVKKIRNKTKTNNRTNQTLMKKMTQKNPQNQKKTIKRTKNKTKRKHLRIMNRIIQNSKTKN